jgi:ribosomal-protein-alanine N-acetyltransferase
MIFRSATAADVAAMMSLERLCSTAAHWTAKQYQELFGPGVGARERFVIVVKEEEAQESVADSGSETSPDGSILGFLVARHLAPEWELENIVVAPAARRKGLGRELLEALLTRARETHSDAVFLEVRESNASARALYEAAGFEQTGRRKSYYTGPEEDAILFRRGLRYPFS